jgi:hypothetical protein
VSLIKNKVLKTTTTLYKGIPGGLLSKEETGIAGALKGSDPMLKDSRPKQDHIPWQEGNLAFELRKT